MSTNLNPPSEPNRCVVCGAHVREGSPSVCWLCREEAEVIARKTPVGSLPASPDRPPPLPPMEPEHFSFALGTLMLAMTLATVLCGLSVIAPGLGIPLVIVSIPAWIRASRAIAVDPRMSGNATLGDKLEEFFTSLGIVFLLVWRPARPASRPARSPFLRLLKLVHPGISWAWDLGAD